MIFLFSNKFIYLFFIVIFFQGITYFDISYTIFNLLLLFDYIDTFIRIIFWLFHINIAMLFAAWIVQENETHKTRCSVGISFTVQYK